MSRGPPRFLRVSWGIAAGHTALVVKVTAWHVRPARPHTAEGIMADVRKGKVGAW